MVSNDKITGEMGERWGNEIAEKTKRERETLFKKKKKTERERERNTVDMISNCIDYFLLGSTRPTGE